jgi:hypothetical protein
MGRFADSLAHPPIVANAQDTNRLITPADFFITPSPFAFD